MLPIVLAGPILRRTQKNGVWIWLATSSPFTLSTHLYQIEKPTSSTYTPFPHTCETKGLRLGENLFVYLLHAMPEPDQLFPVDTWMAYDILFSDEKHCFTLSSLELNAPADRSICYGHFRYPSFYIPSSRNHGSFLYGSCRKLHGKGSDSLAAADLKLEMTAHSIAERPSFLILVGDQIYADDVASPLMHVILELSGNMRGTHHEQLEQLEPKLSVPSYRNMLNTVNSRQAIVSELAGLTSGHAANHMMCFHEYAALYLLSFNPKIWPEKDSLANLCPRDDSNYAAQLDRLYDTKGTLYRVRRLLANIPTYMIFDDHDITDDWNLTASWVEQVRNRPLGRHIVANGLAAYWVFQGWGNDPDVFQEPFRKAIEMHSQTLDVHADSSTYQNYLRALEQFDHWWFIAPTQPPCIVLDTRTQRTFDGTLGPPRLVGVGQLARITAAAKGLATNKPVLVASATPVYGIGVQETVVQNIIYPLVNLFGSRERLRLDYEAWKYNGAGFTDLIEWITEQPFYQNCIFLSGDVHTATTVTSSVTLAGGKCFTVVQLTSSAIKNISFPGLTGLAVKFEMVVKGLARLFKISRYCSTDYRIIHGKVGDEYPFHWKDEVRYIRKRNGTSLIDTKDNLGSVKWEHEKIVHSLLRYRNEMLEQVEYLPIEKNKI